MGYNITVYPEDFDLQFYKKDIEKIKKIVWNDVKDNYTDSTTYDSFDVLKLLDDFGLDFQELGDEVFFLNSFNREKLGTLEDLFNQLSRYLRGWIIIHGEDSDSCRYRFEGGVMHIDEPTTFYGDVFDYFMNWHESDLPKKLKDDLNKWNLSRKI